MKRFISFLSLLVVSAFCLGVMAQNYQMHVKLDDGTSADIPVDRIMEITWSKLEAIDLGLSVKWATCNVGANNPEEYGDYYAWGETEVKDCYDWNSYKYCNGSGNSQTKYCISSSFGTVDNKTILDPEDDVAHVRWGGDWRMPTKEELDELRTKCSWTWTNLNGVNGYIVMGPNGNSIFFPVAGGCTNMDVLNVGQNGYYWSSTLTSGTNSCACCLLLRVVGVEWRETFTRSNGFSVRAVCP